MLSRPRARQGSRAGGGVPARRTGPAPRRPGPVRSDPLQPRLERREVHRPRRGRDRGRDRAADTARGGAPRRRHRHRGRHRRRCERPTLRRLHPGRPVDHPTARRDRPRPGDLPPAGRGARRRDLGDQRARHRQHLLLHRHDWAGSPRPHPPNAMPGRSSRVAGSWWSTTTRPTASSWRASSPPGSCGRSRSPPRSRRWRPCARRSGPGTLRGALLDLVMPDVDGLELARRVRADPTLTDTRLLLLSSEQSVTRQQIADAGISGRLEQARARHRAARRPARPARRSGRAADR